MPPDPLKPAPFEFITHFADAPEHRVEHHPHVRLIATCVATQQQAGFGHAIDLRQHACPACGSPGYSTGWGFIRFLCSAEFIPGDPGLAEPCQGPIDKADPAWTVDAAERLRITQQEVRRARAEAALSFSNLLTLHADVARLTGENIELRLALGLAP